MMPEEPESSTASRPSAVSPPPHSPPPPMNKASTSGFSAPAPAGHGIRRAMTIDESALRRRPPISSRSSDASSAAGGQPQPQPRRSSNFSEYSLNEARDFLNPKPSAEHSSVHENSSLAGLSLAFALLPAIGGALFKDGSAVITDIMLLGLAGVFLHWSVTQPWAWYHSAQEIRIENDPSNEAVFDDDSDLESLATAPVTQKKHLDNVPEEEEDDDEGREDREGDTTRGGFKTQSEDEKHPEGRQQAALNELYLYEVMALISCFALPIVSAYLLHAIRSQLSRPSEGLVSNYNLTIFLLMSELRAFSHLFKLLQSRTLHLQKVVHANPYEAANKSGAQWEELLNRLDRLESRSTAEEKLVQQSLVSPAPQTPQDVDVVAHDVRSAIQPDLDALSRAMRRYEKKTTMLQVQTESRLADVDARLDDAIALAAAAAKNSVHRKNIVAQTTESAMALVLFPFKAFLQLLMLPVQTLFGSRRSRKGKTNSSKSVRASKSAKVSSTAKYSGDRVPSRVVKR